VVVSKRGKRLDPTRLQNSKCDHEAHTICLSQHTYLEAIIHHYSFKGLKPLSIPMDMQAHLHSDQTPSSMTKLTVMCDMPYHKAVGALNWAALATHPNITFTVSTVVHFTTNPRPVHWDAIKWIYRYLAGTLDVWLVYGETMCTLKGYNDADGSMAKDHHTISGYAFLINSGAISWASKC
jgi:hypothetical protein